VRCRTKLRKRRFPKRSQSEDLAIRRHPLLLLASIWLLCSATLPEHVPIPEQRPDSVTSEGQKLESDSVPPDAKAGQKPVKEKPVEEKAIDGKAADDKATETKPAIVPPPPIETEDPAAYASCKAALTLLGATFKEIARIDDGEGCGIDKPIEVTTVGGGVALIPPGTMRCQTATNLARWTSDVVIPMLKKAQPAEKLAAIDQASAYICRKRNGISTGKISEHARGTAVDIAGFTFQSGKTFTIAPREEEPTLNGAFQRSIAAAACLYFSTVLDPGSDAAHETHLHLDTLKRRGSYRYCW
jgi:hypothetical protein